MPMILILTSLHHDNNRWDLHCIFTPHETTRSINVAHLSMRRVRHTVGMKGTPEINPEFVVHVRPNPPPLSVLVRVMVLIITCIVCILKMLSSHPKAFMSFWITLFINNSLLACGRIGLLKGPTGGLGNTSSQGYSPCTFDYPLLHFVIARVLHFLHCYLSDMFNQ